MNALNEANEKCHTLEEKLTETSFKLSQVQQSQEISQLKFEEEKKQLKVKVEGGSNFSWLENRKNFSLEEATEHIRQLEKDILNKNKLMQDLV